MIYRKYCKSAIDFVLAFLGLLLASHVFIVIALVLTLNNRGTPFFLQERPGKNGRIFRVIKFKTMNNRRDSSGALLPDDMRLTKAGRLMRKLSLDEIPQLINVLKGDMCLIGPRPLLPEYLPLYSKEQARRHDVKPGITGWAQVNGRNDVTWEEKFTLDVWYVDHLSALLDLKILFMTIWNVIRREGISKDGFATTEKFNGHN